MTREQLELVANDLELVKKAASHAIELVDLHLELVDDEGIPVQDTDVDKSIYAVIKHMSNIVNIAGDRILFNGERQ